MSKLDSRIEQRIVGSAVWAAVGDALGFMSELTDHAGLKRRMGADHVQGLCEWHRTVGGRFGALAPLPFGCYSDDTQLRLCTSRAINGRGRFDVESFAKIELPVWLSYSLGAGEGVKSAATNLTLGSVNWFSNFYSGKSRSYLMSGGNGAAMRIQPHVWASKDLFDVNSYLLDVFKNAVCTHGNLHGILGAVFHALTLGYVLHREDIPGPAEWRKFLLTFDHVAELVAQDRELSSFWLPVWESRSERSFPQEVQKVKDAFAADVALVGGLSFDDLEGYRRTVEAVGGLNPSTRGSGLKTSLLACCLAWNFRTRDPFEALLLSANLLGSDTDTIGTMAGALLGAKWCERPRQMPMDADYIVQEATRLVRIREGATTVSFPYPDLARWTPPKSQSDAVGEADERLGVVGLGYASPVGSAVSARGKQQSKWGWLVLEFGQSILAKMRDELPVIDVNQLPATSHLSVAKDELDRQVSLFAEHGTESTPQPRQRDLDEMTREAMSGKLDPATIGNHLLELSARDDGIELCVAYAAIIAKTRRARLAKQGEVSGRNEG